MAVKIRLFRKGKKHNPCYSIVVARSEVSRDGIFIEKLGNYNPCNKKNLFDIKTDRINYWLSCGAIPNTRILKLISSDSAIIIPIKIKNKFEKRRKVWEKNNLNPRKEKNNKEKEENSTKK